MAELSSKYDPKAIEQKWFNFWMDNEFHKADNTKDAPSYTIVIPPPNITGILHIGHGLNNTLQDVLIRMKRMQGFNTLWVPGTDHAGIATQNVVEKNLMKDGKSRHDLGRAAFHERCLEWKEKYGGTILNQLKLMGCSCDWTRERFTLDEGLSRAVRTVFKKLYDEGLVYRGNYMVNWCPRCHTALADDEVEYQDKEGKLWHIKYPVEGTDEFIVVATTRPETMLGDTAVAINPNDERNKHLHGKKAILPLMNRPIPFILDEYVSLEFGTGLVKVTPAHDPNDYEMGKRHDLPVINILTSEGKINKNGGKYEGLDRYAARKKVVEDLEALGLIEKIDSHSHAVGHCYRCHTVIEPYISLQWFVQMKPLAEPAIKAVEEGRTKIVPKTWEATYFHWMRNVRDWCISRQLWWGHQIPAWICQSCGHVEVVADGSPDICTKCRSANLKQEEDVLDTWFSSALWPFSTLGWPDETKDLKTYYPTSVLITAHEILFFWVARMIMMGLKFMGDVPFRDVYIHAMVFDEITKKKMSKSLGNIIDPVEMIDKFGTDALRLTLCAYAIQGSNLYLSEKRFEGYRNFANKLWNAARFVLTNTEDLTPEELAEGVDEKLLGEDDKWILGSFAKTSAEFEKCLEQYEFDKAVSALYHFIWDDYCDWYIEWAKPRLYRKIENADADKVEAMRKNSQKILVLLLDGMLKLLHPMAPFITEELWAIVKERYNKNISKSEIKTKDALTNLFFASISKPALMVSDWIKLEDAGYLNEAAEKNISYLRQIIVTARTIRAQMNIPPGMKTDIAFSSGSDEEIKFIETNKDFFTTLVKTGELSIGKEIRKSAFSSLGVVGELSIAITLPRELAEEEKKRLERELGKIDQEIEKVSKKLSNESYVQKAPPEVVQKEKEKLAKAESEQKQIKEKLASFGE